MKALLVLEQSCRNEERPGTPHQTEFFLPVAVCAWCHPRQEDESEVVSHGICPRHFQEILRQVRSPGAQPGKCSAALPGRPCQIELLAVADSR
jgi:hypothetical protein